MKNTKIKLPKKQIDVKLPNEIADKLNPIAMKIGEQFKLYGLRAKINFRSLLKCLAHRNGRKVVADEDFQEFLELADFMNFNYNAWWAKWLRRLLSTEPTRRKCQSNSATGRGEKTA